MNADFTSRILAALDAWQAEGKVARLWLRDDDAVAPTPALQRLLALTAGHGVPVALAVIPEPSGTALADLLAQADHVTVTVHGWTHENHALEAAKKQELGPERPAEIVLAELASGFTKLRDLHDERFLPMLVPPWNRIDKALLSHLGALGYEALSVYGREKPGPLPVVNTHVDVMDWHGSRGCRPSDDLAREIVERLDFCRIHGGSTGLLTHHLVHDEAVWAFMDALLTATADHPACRWMPVGSLIAEA